MAKKKRKGSTAASKDLNKLAKQIGKLIGVKGLTARNVLGALGKTFGKKTPRAKSKRPTGSVVGNVDEFTSGLEKFLGGNRRYADFTSSNVTSSQYDPKSETLYLAYGKGKGKRWYGYEDVAPKEAASFYTAPSKGTWVWDHLRVRGSRTAHQVPYFSGAPPDTISSSTRKPRQKKFAGGLIQQRLGTPGQDNEPIYTEPGEFVVTKQGTQKNLAILHAINRGMDMGQVLAELAGGSGKPGGPTPADYLSGPLSPRQRHYAEGGEIGGNEGKGILSSMNPKRLAQWVMSRYGIKTGAAIVASGQAIGWGASMALPFVDALLGSPLGNLLGTGIAPPWIPASTVVGMLPGIAAAELYARYFGGESKFPNASRESLTEAMTGEAQHYAGGGLVSQFQPDIFRNLMEMAPPAAKLLPTAKLLSESRGAQHRADGGIIQQRLGTPGKDNEPIYTEPGEFVVNKQATERFRPLLERMNNQGAPKFVQGRRHFAEGGVTGMVLGGVQQHGGFGLGSIASIALGAAAGATVGGGPLGAVIGGLIAAVGELKSGIADFRRSAQNPSGAIAAAVSPYASQVAAFNPGLIEKFSIALDNLSASLGHKFEPIIERAEAFANWLNSIVTGIGPEWRDNMAKLSDLMSGATRRAISIVVQEFEKLQPAIGRFLDMMERTKLVENVGEVFGQLLGVSLRLVEAFTRLADVLDKIGLPTGVSRSLGGVSQTLDQWGPFAALGITGPGMAAFSAHALWNATMNTSNANPSGQTPGATAGQGMTFAGRQAGQIGIEEIGMQARAAAFSQGGTIAERQLTQLELLNERNSQIYLAILQLNRNLGA